MSILAGNYDDGVERKASGDDELLVFGYTSKLYRDDTRALLEDSGALLIPWMGDSSLLVDRYDVRNRLEDKAQFGLKSNLPHRSTREEDAFEDLLDLERYLSLQQVEEDLAEGEDKKRLFENLDGSYSAVGFSYAMPPPSEAPMLPSAHEHPPSSAVDVSEGDEESFCPPAELALPAGMEVPVTAKLHSIIEKTALFIGKQGPQMEIVIKAKQKFNPFFSFLYWGDALFPYYQHVKQVLASGRYSPRPPSLEYEPPPASSATNDGQVFGGKPVDTSLRTETTEAASLPGNPPAGLEDRTSTTAVLCNGGEGDSDENRAAKVSPEGVERQTMSDLAVQLATTIVDVPTVAVCSAEGSGGVVGDSSDSAVDGMSSGGDGYENVASEKVTQESGVSSDTDSDSDNSDDEGFELHPLLRGALTPQSSKPSTPSRDDPRTGSPVPAPVAAQGRGEGDQGDGAVHSSAFFSKRLSVNSAPVVGSSNSEGHQQYSQFRHSPQPGGGSLSEHYHRDGGVYDHAAYSYYTQNLQAYYEALSASHINTPGPTPPPPDLQPVVDKTAYYVAKNDSCFETTVIKKHCDDPKFSFLNPWDQYHSYYQAKKAEFLEEIGRREAERIAALEDMPNLQRLTSSGSVSFKLQPKAPSHLVSAPDPSTVEEVEEGEEGEGCEPTAKKRRMDEEEEEEGGDGDEADNDIIGDKVGEFLSQVKMMLGTD